MSADTPALEQLIEVEDDMDTSRPRPDCQSWCTTCGWDGSGKHLLERPQVDTIESQEWFMRDLAKVDLSDDEPPLYDSSIGPPSYHQWWYENTWNGVSENELQISATAGNICCALLLGLHLSRYSGLEAFQDLVEVSSAKRYWHIFMTCEGPPPLQGIPHLPPGFRPPVDTESLQSLAWAEGRIEECVSSHPCSSLDSSAARSLPSRLIDIGERPEIAGVVLRDTRDFSSDTQYIALSHCWGDHKPKCITTSKNYARQCQNIPWADIPKTFREAIQFTQRLKVRYIWIDSVCIIQPGDDQYYDDWLHEAVRMSDYYYNAYVTLAAASSVNCNGGLYSKQPDRKHYLFRATVGGVYCRFFAVRNSEDVRHRRPDDFAELQTHRWPLGTRGWVYQERLVSCRVLYFTAHQLIFDCYRGLAPQEWSHYGHPEPSTSLKQFYWELLNDTADLLPWQKIIEEYSALHLTNLGDRLPAMAAIAQQVLAQQGPEGELGNTYLCGLMASSLHLELPWLTVGDGPGHRQDSRCLAPSWSWASYPAQVRHHWNHWRDCKSQVELVGDSLEFTASGRFGSCTGGYITIKAPVIDCVWEVVYDPHGSLQTQALLLDPRSSPEQRIMRFHPDYPAGYQGLEGLKSLDEVEVKAIQVCSDPLGVLFLYQSPETKLYRRLGADVYSDGQISRLAPAGPGFPGVTASGTKAVVWAPDFAKAGRQTLRLG